MFANDTGAGGTPAILMALYFYPPDHAHVLNGYLTPLLTLFTIITNTMVCAVLLKKHMRSPTNALLVGMALSDMLTGVFTLPVFIYFFTLNNYKDYIPYDWCWPVKYFGIMIPTVFHTASIWLTMALAVQRYIYICHSFQAKTWCTIPNVIRGTVAIYVIAILSQVSRIIEVEHVPYELPSLVQPNSSVVGCVERPLPWITPPLTRDVYYNIYFWFRVLCIHMLPCISLVVLNALLIHAMRTAQKRRKQLLQQNKKSESKKIKDSNCTTLMLVAVVGLFLVVEFPLGVIMVFVIIMNTFNLQFVNPLLIKTLMLWANFFILLSYPLNFFIYCGMSRQFRETFKRMFVKGPMPLDREWSQYVTLATENGRTQMTGAETAL